MFHHFDPIQVLFWKAEQLGQERRLVVIFNVVNSFETLQVFGCCVLHLLKQLLIIEVELPNLSVVVIFVVIDHLFIYQLLHWGLISIEVADI